MSSFRLIIASLLYHWRMNLAVACGVAAGAAVLSGALLVGDSMRGSLRELTLGRLGRIDEVLLTEHFFRQELAEELAAQPEFSMRFTAAVPAIILPASLETTDQEDKMRANRVNLLGCDSRFWGLWSGKYPELTRDQIVLNRPLADRLGVRKAGDEVILHLPQLGTIPGDSPLGTKTDTIKRIRLTVAAIEEVDAEGPGRFSFRANQRLPLNAYVSIGGLQGRLDRTGRVNAILVTGQSAGAAPALPIRTLEKNHNVLQRLLRPTPADYGIRIEEVRRDRPAQRPSLPAAQQGEESRYINIASDRMLLEPAVEAAIRQTLKEAGKRFQPVLTYLANVIDVRRHDATPEGQGDDGRIIPYSTITAVDFARTPLLGPFPSPDANPVKRIEDEGGKSIVLNSWTADELGVTPGDKVYVTYFQPESTHAEPEERTDEFTVAAVVDLAGPADDRAFTPVVPGLTDKKSINSWQVPFSPFRKRLIRSKDDDYFKQYGLTPKAFVSLATGQRLWGSRFGRITSFRVEPDEETTVDGLAEKLQSGLEPERLGFAFQPVKLQGLDASAGTTPFNVLFLSFSFFIIAAAVMLVALLFRLGIDQRAAQLGLLVAVGFSRRRIALLLAGEGLVVSVLGSLLGVPAGVGYAALMILGLRTWWVKAVVTPFLQLHLTPPGHRVPWSLAMGFLSGVIVALLAVVWAVWRSRRAAARRLLAGQMTEAAAWIAGPPRHAAKLAWAMLLAAVVLGLLATRFGEEIQAGAFFGAGALVLMASLTLLWCRLRRAATGSAVAAPRQNLLPVVVFYFIAVVLALRALVLALFLVWGIVLLIQEGNPRSIPIVILAGGLDFLATVLLSLLAAHLARSVNVLRMAVRNAARNPGRSTLTIGLVAAACFLIVAVSAFRLDPGEGDTKVASGTGGFALVAQSDQPIYQDLNTPTGREELGFTVEDQKLLAETATIALRVKPGDDASCLNLYRPQQPRVLGLPRRMIERGGFVFAASDAKSPQQRENPWLLLEKKLGKDGKDTDGVWLVPVILEKNTATYSLKPPLGVGDTYEITGDRGETVRLKVVGLLGTSIFQGDLLIRETAFLRHFPEAGGPRFFLTEAAPERTDAVGRALQTTLGEYGFAAQRSGRRLAGFMVVQNTYLSTFQNLGGLGLLLGTFGLAAVQLRNVLERRSELALLRATGFRRRRLAEMVMLENGLLLCAGLGCGMLAALVAVLPHLLFGRASIPWPWLAGTLALVMAVGLVAGLAAVRTALTAPLLAALREE